MTKKFYVMKNEPSEFSIDHLQAQGVGVWDGIRNYQARNIMKEMKVGEEAFFYHSSCAQPGIYGRMAIEEEHFPDPLALDRKSDYFDAKATKEKNPWVCVKVKFVEKYRRPLLLEGIRGLEEALGPCRLTARGNRLSVIPVSEEQFRCLEREVLRINALPEGESTADAEPKESKKKPRSRPAERAKLSPEKVHQTRKRKKNDEIV